MLTRSKIKKAPKRIEVRNAWFDSLTRMEQRMVLAYDALELTKSKIKLCDGKSYFYMPSHVEEAETKSLQKYLRKRNLEPECKVCALGAMICSYSYTKNYYELDENYIDLLGYDGFSSNRLENYFSKNELRLIEMFFEADIDFLCPEEDEIDMFFSEEYDEAVTKMEIVKESSSSKERFEAIMNHIIDTQGKEVYNGEFFDKYDLEPNLNIL